MDYSFEMCMRFGKVYISEECKACALLIYPELKRTTFKSIGLDIKLIFNAIGVGNVFKAMKFMIHSIFPMPCTFLNGLPFLPFATFN